MRLFQFFFALVIGFAIPVSASQSRSAAQPPAPAPKTEAHGAPVIPDTFTNLKVLPQNITKPQLMGVMKGFCISTGVRCAHCHAVSDDLTEGSFASDEKEAKTKARELLRAILATRDDITQKVQ